MTRLTNTIRHSIRDAVLEHRFKAPVSELLDRADELGDRTYEFLYPSSILDQMKSLPSDFFRTDNRVNVYALGERRVIFFGRHINNLEGIHHILLKNRPTKELITAHKFRADYNVSVSLSKELYDIFEKLIQDVERHNEIYSSARSQVQAALDAVGSVKALIAAWPEVEPFASMYLETKTERVRLPAIPAASLNAILDLPVDTPVDTPA